MGVTDKDKLGDYKKYVWPHTTLINLGVLVAWIVLLGLCWRYAAASPYLVMLFIPLAGGMLWFGLVYEHRVKRNAVAYLENLSRDIKMFKISTTDELTDLADSLDIFIGNHFD